MRNDLADRYVDSLALVFISRVFCLYAIVLHEHGWGSKGGEYGHEYHEVRFRVFLYITFWEVNERECVCVQIVYLYPGFPSLLI